MFGKSQILLTAGLLSAVLCGTVFSETILEEYFDGIFPPSGWTLNSIDQKTTQSHTESYSAYFSAGSDYLITPPLTNAQTLTFWAYTTSADPEIIVETASSTSGPWTAVDGSPFSGNTDQWNERTINFPGSETVYVKFNKNGSGSLYIDDVTATDSGTTPVNNPPVLAAIGNKALIVSNSLSFSVSATDADNDSIILSASNLPPGAVFNTVTNAGTVSNTFLWANAAPTGIYTTTFYADDGTTNDSETVLITVTNLPPTSDVPPILDSIGNKEALEGDPISFTVTASDPTDGDPVTLSATNLPSGSVFTNGTFTWSNATPAGVYSVTFFATDKDGSDSETITITISERPVLMITEIADPAGTGNYYYRFVEIYNAGSSAVVLDSGSWFLCMQANGDSWNDLELSGTIPAGETWVVAYNSSKFQEAYGFAPDQAGSSINGTGNDAFFLYTGGDHSSGTLVDIYGEFDTDGTDTDWEYTDCRVVRNSSASGPNTTWTASEWTIVADAEPSDMDPGAAYNVPPVLNAIGNKGGIESGTISFSISATDLADGDSITYSATNLPVGAVFSGDTFTWDVAGPVGQYPVTFFATDKDGTDSETITVTVIDKPLLMISEIADPANYGDYRFVELYNAGTTAIDLEGSSWNLCKQVNGDSWTDIPLAGTIQSGDTYVIAYNESSFERAYGFTPEASSTAITGNGDDVYALFFGGDHSSGTLVDIYGEIDVDGTGTAWEYEDSLAARNAAATGPSTTWIASEWTITRDADSDRANPGNAYNAPPFIIPIGNQGGLESRSITFTVTAEDIADNDEITLSATGLPPGAIFTNGVFFWETAGPLGTFYTTFTATDDDGSDSETVAITVIEQPRVIISEVADPSDDGDYRFVELYNLGDDTVNLDTENWYLCLQANGGSWYCIHLTGTLAPAATWVIADSAVDFEDAYGLSPDQESSIASGNGNDAYFLYYGGNQDNGILIDIYGEFDTDGDGTAWDYEDSRAERSYDVSAPSSEWVASEWTIQSADSDSMTPGQHGPLPQINLSDDLLFVFSGDSFDFTFNATNTVDAEDTISLSATNLPAQAAFTGASGIGSATGHFTWNNPDNGTYSVTFIATGKNGSIEQNETLTVSDHSSLNEWFYRWKGINQIYELGNGQFWQQVSREDYGNYGLYHPDVYIEKSSSEYRMTIPNVTGSIEVQKLLNPVSTRIDGTFGGCSEGVIVKLRNGTWWRQTSSEQSSRSDYLPDALTWQTADSFEMFIEDEEQPITVEQLAVTESEVTGLISSFSMARNKTYQLADGTVWKQTSSSDSVSVDDTDITAWRWTEDGITWIRFVDSSNLEIGTCRVESTSAPANPAIISHIDGYFRGWKGQRVFALQNGEYWQQTTPTTVEQTLYNPLVVITNIQSTGTWQMRVEDALPPAYVEVEQLTDVTRLAIDGWFHGFRQGNFLKLSNGTWRRQTSSEIVTYSRFKPEILLYADSRIEMPDLGTAIETELLDIQAESTVTNTFTGLAYGNIYILQNAETWQQTSTERTRTAYDQPTAMLWMENSRQKMLLRDDLDQTIGTCSVVNPDNDDDNDGASNFAEVIAGTGLQDATDRFLITDIQHNAEGRAVLSWTPSEGRSYAVEWTPSLNETFQTLETGIEWPQTSWTNIFDENGGFYRIQVQLESDE